MPITFANMRSRELLASKLRDERGSVLLLVAASLTVLLGCGAFVLDLGNTRQTARSAQNAADTGAVAGAVGLPGSVAPINGGTTAYQFAADFAFQTLLGQTAGTLVACDGALPETPFGPLGSACYQGTGSQGSKVYVTWPWWPDALPDGTTPPGNQRIHVKVCSDVTAGLARVFGVDSFRPCREAAATNALTFSPFECALCVMASGGAGALRMTGSGDLNVTGNVVVNSNTDNGGCSVALALEGAGSLTATTAGGISVRDPSPTGPGDAWETCLGASGTFTPTPQNSFLQPIDDSLCPNPNYPSTCLSYPGEPGCPPNPPPAECTGTTIWAPGDTIGPGIYDSITVNSGTLTMLPGLYVFRGPAPDSRFEINGGTVVANGVTLFFGCQDYPATCNAGERGSYISLGKIPAPCEEPPERRPPCTTPSPAKATFTAPPPGSYPDGRIPGMAIFFDRNNTSAPSDVTPGIGIWGDASLSVTGTIYASSGHFKMVAGGAADLNSGVIVQTFEHSGSGGVSVNFDPEANVKITGRISLIQSRP